MGPTACFDKSFLQSLSVDESVWFDQYFTTVITPLFFVETLADLEKQVKAGRSPEDEVGNIANKTPEQSGSPNVFHATLCNGELRGYLHVAREARLVHAKEKASLYRPYDTVRGAFFEGKPLFEGSGIMAQTHIQLAVREPKTSIRGYFRPPPETQDR